MTSGRIPLVELTASAGYYAMLACTGFAVGPDPGADRLPER
jgi:hypothetical protein